MKESARYILPILVFVSLVLSIGTGGYLIIEDGITVSDAFYMTVTAITPAQFDEVHVLSVPGRYFTVVLVFCGFGAVVAFATQFARLIVQSELEGVGVITRKQMSRRIRQMKNHYIVCGYGEIGSAICDELKDQHLPFVVVTDDELSVAAIKRDGHALVRGHPTADSSLKEAGVEQAVGVIAVLADDADNLFISLAARELNPQIFIIARGEDSSVEDRILRAGADIVVSPVKLSGRQIAELVKQQAGASSSVNVATPQTSVMGLRLAGYRHTSDEPTTVANVLEKLGAIGVAGVHRRNGSFQPSPPPAADVHLDDALVLITRTEEIGDHFHQQLRGKTILLADDHRALRLLFSRKLAAAGHDVIQAATGDDALRLARSRTPDLIVLDVNMPHKDGYQVCAALRQSPQFADVPIILYSGEKTEEFVNRGRVSGADMCIRKTSKSSELLARIEDVFSKQGDPVDNDHAAAPLVAASAGTAPDQSPADDVFDFDVVMENVGGDQQLLSDLASTMLEETPRIMRQIGAAIAQLDANAMQRAAHSLKSSVAILGARDAVTAAESLEAAGQDGELDNVDQLHTELQLRIQSLMAALEKYSSKQCDSSGGYLTHCNS